MSIIAVLLACSVTGTETTKEGKKKKKKKKVYPDYIYGEDAGLVKEFIATSSDLNPEHPDFMFGENKPARVIVFYQPWCPHVRITNNSSISNIGHLMFPLQNTLLTFFVSSHSVVNFVNITLI